MDVMKYSTINMMPIEKMRDEVAMIRKSRVESKVNLVGPLGASPHLQVGSANAASAGSKFSQHESSYQSTMIEHQDQ